MEPLTIKQLSDQSGVPVGTIRYYERKGLLAPPQRTDAGYRQYQADIIPRLHFIKQAQSVGFTLKEIQELLTLRVTPSTTKADIKKRALQKIQSLEAKDSALQRMKQALEEITHACDGGHGPVSDCPIIEALEKSNLKEKYQF